MAKKIYCVKVGRKTGFFNSWDECKKQIDGFSGAVYKSFTNMQEAENYMGLGKSLNKIEVEESEKAVAYVDGSYKHETREFSCGAVLFYKGEEKHFSEKFSSKSMAEMRNVAGEIMGSVTIIKYCLENKIKSISIYYDYEGVAKWAMGEWKANKEGTKAYRDFCKAKMEEINIEFVKVKGHSGDKYNDLADKLAKQALGII